VAALDALATDSQASTASEVDLTGAGALTSKVVMKMYRKVRTGGSSFLADIMTVDWDEIPTGVDVVEMDPHLSPYEARFTIQRTAGTDRTYNWEVNEV